MADENMFSDLIPQRFADANMFADLIPKEQYTTDPIRTAYQATMNNVAKPINNAVGNVMGALIPQKIKDKLSQAGDYFANQDAITSPVYQAAKEGITQLGENIDDLKSYNQDLAHDLPALGENAKLAGNLAVIKPAINAIGDLGGTKTMDLLKNEASGGADVLPTPLASKASPIDPRVAGLVQNATDLGINIPPRVFYPGSASDALTKAGLMSGDTMKSDVTTALSKVMGHEGTPNLDIDTMNDIQKNIGAKMDSFALKADDVGGIPISKTATDVIGDESLADAPKVTKLIQKIHDRVDENGNLSGSDYQALTKKGGVLDRAINSTDSEFADTAQKLRAHLDDQLEQTVHPDDLAAFKNARREYRTMKIVQPIVESGGITGQPDSASKLFGAVSRNYGGISNALKYNPDLGKIAQIVNEFPEAVKDSPKPSLLAKVGTLATAPAALGVGAIGGIPAGLTAAAALPVAKGAAMYLGSAGRKASLLAKSLPKVETPPLAEVPQDVFTQEQAAATMAPKAAPNMYSGITAKVDAMRPEFRAARLASLTKKATSNAGLTTAEMAEMEALKSKGFSKGGAVRKNLTAEFLSARKRA